MMTNEKFFQIEYIHKLQAFKDEDRQRGPRKHRGTLGKTSGPGVGNSYAIFGKIEGP